MAGNRVSIAERVVERVAEETDTDPLSLPPLAESLDPDALNALVATLSDGGASFRYAGCDVAVDHAGAVQVEERLQAEEPSGQRPTDRATD